MQVKISNFVIKCENCGKEYVIEIASLNKNVESYERSMGTEELHIYEGEKVCEECGNDMRYTITVSEYSVGDLNDFSSACQRCIMIKETVIEVTHNI